MCLPLLPSAIAGYITLISFCAIPLCFITLLTLFLMWRHKKERYILLCLLALSLTYLHPYIPLTSSHFSSLEERQVPGTLTVVSWNADNFQLSEDTLRAAVQTITHLHPDIICLQERPHTSLLDIAKIKSALHDYPYMVTNSREDEILNVIVFSRFPLSHPQSHYFTHTFNKYLSVDVHLPQTISPKIPRLRLYDIHLQTTGLNDHEDGSTGSFWQRILLPFRANSIVRKIISRPILPGHPIPLLYVVTSMISAHLMPTAMWQIGWKILTVDWLPLTPIISHPCHNVWQRLPIAIPFL